MQYLPTIGLEVHAELKTRTKMFCDSANDPDESSPNTNVCPVCLAHPGTLPVINHEAVRHILRLGTAVGGTIAEDTEFDRKSYFYPDIPKGYQISQYEHPLVSGGTLAGIAITRVHLEEDTARSIHASGKTLVDFNRAGIPLMELVTEPVIRSAKEAGRFARELQLLLRTLGAGEANLEKGEMRVEANISVAPKHEASSAKNQTNPKHQMGTKVEVKNLNSFRSVERAVAFEVERQSTLIESGSAVVQETRGWDEAKQQTFHQRLKEGSADYRYFPEPDLPSLRISLIPEFRGEALAASLPELPWERRARYKESFALKEDDIEFLLADTTRTAFFDTVTDEFDGDAKSVTLAANYFISDLAGISGKATPPAFASLIRMLSAHTLSSRGAKDTLAVMVEQGGDPEAIAQEHGLIQIVDTTALGAVVDTVIAREADAVAQYRAGNTAVLQYLVGKAMQESRAAGNPLAFKELLITKLS